LFALGDDAMAELIAGVQFLPTTIMMVHLCPAVREECRVPCGVYHLCVSLKMPSLFAFVISFYTGQRGRVVCHVYNCE
jgi:hypothetical protein